MLPPRLLEDIGLCQVLFPSLVLRDQEMEQHLSLLESPSWPMALSVSVGA